MWSSSTPLTNYALTVADARAYNSTLRSTEELTNSLTFQSSSIGILYIRNGDGRVRRKTATQILSSSEVPTAY